MYSILELQTNDGVTAALPIEFRETQNEAMSVFHGKLSFAATSDVEYHTVVVFDEEGRYLARECYKHIKEPVASETAPEAVVLPLEEEVVDESES